MIFRGKVLSAAKNLSMRLSKKSPTFIEPNDWIFCPDSTTQFSTVNDLSLFYGFYCVFFCLFWLACFFMGKYTYELSIDSSNNS